jgi:hypothetical protein
MIDRIRINRTGKIIGCLAIVVGVCGAAASPPHKPAGEYKNLKVLPRDISSKRLQQIMVDEFEDGLGVGCGFCHAQQKGSSRLDYASDAKPEKEIARAMMRMSIKINRKYFQAVRPMIGDSTLTITCSTCHHGEAHPSP